MIAKNHGDRFGYGSGNDAKQRLHFTGMIGKIEQYQSNESQPEGHPVEGKCLSVFDICYGKDS